MLPVNHLRFDPLPSAKSLGELTQSKIKILEEAACIDPDEKTRLLALLCSKRWTTELGIGRAGKQQTASISSLLNKLSLPWRNDKYTKRDGTVIHWVQVGANKAVIEYLSANRERMSVMEAGLLYGYPPSALLACAGILELKRKNSNQKTPAERCLGGLFSKHFHVTESAYYKAIFDELRRISPSIIREAEFFTSLL